MSLFAWKCKHIDLCFFSTPPSKAKLPSFLTEGNMRNFILKLNLFSLVFTMFFKLAALRQKNIQFQPYLYG